MSEFKFACPVCGQRMAVDSSACGAQVECPTCFQIIIVPKAPLPGSKYQLSATQYIKPVVLPPPPKPPTPAPAAPQKKSAALIFGLILMCAFITALFIREKIAGPPEEGAAASAKATPPSPSSLWTLDLTNKAFPDRTVAGEINGKDFVCRQAVMLENGMLILRSERGWQASISATVSASTNLFSTNAPEILSGRSFEVSTNHVGMAPNVSLFWQEGELRVWEMFTNGFAMKLEYGNLSSNRLPGKIYVCLPDEMKSYMAGSFTAEVERFPRPRAAR